MMRFLRRLVALLIAVLALSWLQLARPFAIDFGDRVEVAQANADALQRYTNVISSDFSPRDWKHPGNLDRLSNFLADQFRRFNERVSFQSFSVQGNEYRNVISEYGPREASPMVVVGAHYDAFGELPGADDNASGVAGLLELGRLLAKQELPLKVQLVAYSLEEPPFFRTHNMGSAIHSDELVRSKQEVRLMISLEMIGYYSSKPGSQTYPHPVLNLIYPSHGDFIAIVGPASLSLASIELKKAFLRSVPLRAVSMNAPSIVPGVDFSDHLNYWRNGFDALMITDTAFYRNRAYHSREDTADRLDYHKMSQVVTGVYSFLLEMSKET